MSALTLVTVLVVAYGVLGRGGYGRALALGGATAAGAAVVVGGTAVPTFYAIALGALVGLGLKLLGNGREGPATRQPLPPAGALLVLFLFWSGVVTLVAPVVFDGASVLTAAGDPRILRAGDLTSSNLAQLIYLLLGVCVVVFLARSPKSGPELIGLAAGTTTVLSLWRYLHQMAGFPFPEGLFDNSPAFNYIETAPNNVQRFRGILSEPSGLAGSSLVTAAYMLPRAAQVHGWRRIGTLVVAAAAIYLGSISTSATFVVAGVGVVAIAGLTFAAGFLLRRTSVSAVVSVASCIAVVVALWVLPAAAAYVQLTVDQKVSSSSFDDRSASNSTAYGLFLDTFGFGVGLGSTRASAFVPGLLATTGLVGTLLFAAAVATLIHGAAPVRAYRPVIWALVALLVAKVIAGPDLSDSSGILWMSLGLLSGAVLRRSARAGPSGAAELPPSGGTVSGDRVSP